MAAPTTLRTARRLKTVQAPSPVGGLNSVSPYGAMGADECIALVNMIPSAYGLKTRLGSTQWVQHVGSVQATSTFTPPTSATATCVIAGTSFTATFNTNAATTVTNLKALVSANPTVMAQVSLSGTTTMVVTNLQPGALGNSGGSAYVTTTSNGANGASFSAAGTSGGVTNDKEIRSVIGYAGTTAANDRLFVVCTDGIYNATTFNVAATKVVSFSTTTGLAGYCTSTSFTTVAGNFLYVVDEVNGPWVWDETNAVWQQVTMGAGSWQVSGVDPATFTSVMQWQNRLWFTQRATGQGWYLPTGTLYGAALNYPFGSNMGRGGELRCLKSWTVDGGAGVENNLLAVSSAGDISVYTGTDPTTVGKFTQVGTWNFSGLPTGRRIAIDSGGDVLVLTAFGLISVSKLLQGASLVDRSIYETKKVDNLISTEVTVNGSNLNWAVQLSPDESAILISAPQGDGSIVQYAMNYQTRGWGRLISRNAHSMGVWENHLWFGNGTGSVFKATGGQDEVNFSGVGSSIRFTVFSSFQGLDDPSSQKRVQLCRPVFLTQGSDLNWSTFIRYDYDLSQNVTLPTSNPQTGALWDTATWDNAVWGGDAFTSLALNGGFGWGRMVALLLVGICSTPTTLNSIDIMYDSGGLL